MAPLIERATAADVDAIEALLALNHLPLAGFRNHLATAMVAREGGQVVGSAALEVYGDDALLRSVAVSPSHQRQGLGAALTAAAVRLAEQLDIAAVFLLTTTAAAYFPRFGFEPIDRAAVPAGVRSSIEFTSACPANAAVMRKRL